MSALISIRGGYWPGLALRLPDWLRGRQPGLIFLRGPRPARSRRRACSGRGCTEARSGRGRGRELCLSSVSPGGGRSPERTSLCSRRLPPPAARLQRFSPRRGGACRPTENLSRWPRGARMEAHLLQGFNFPVRLPWALFAPSSGSPDPGTLTLRAHLPGESQEDCGLQPSGRFPSQRPLCPRCC